MNHAKTVAVLGAGNRGRDVYGSYILEHQEEIKALAVAEPDLKKRLFFAEKHGISTERQFKGWQQLLSREKLADGIIISTLDKMHVGPAIEAMKKGYTILLEKPIAPGLDETLKLVKEARKRGSKILVAHVLRYTPFYQKIKELLDRRVIGEIRFIDHVENIGYFHYAHSYVRGNWRNTDVAAPIILAKSCHDLDLLYWLLEKKCLTLSSHASQKYFLADNYPENAGERCVNCSVEKNCPYSALKIYMGENRGWPVSVITTDLTYEGRKKALEEGPYGRCVFACDNNVPEVQTARMTFEGDIEVNFALNAFSKRINRKTRIYGSKGELRGDFEKGLIIIESFAGTKDIIKIENVKSGHGGGDAGLMDHFVNILQEDDTEKMRTALEDSVESHIMAFAIEQARQGESVVDLDKLRLY